MIKMILIMFFFSLCSCATFIKKPKEVEKWKYSDLKSCPQTYKVSTEQKIEYYLRDLHIYSCNLTIDSMPTSKCTKRSSYFLDAPEKAFNSQHNNLLKDVPARFPCMVPTSVKDADFEVIIKSTVIEHTYVPWAFATGLTLGLIPLRATYKMNNHIEIKHLKNGKTKILQEDSDLTLWVHLFLLPLMPFIGDGRGHEKIIAHMNSVIFEAMTALERSGLQN